MKKSSIILAMGLMALGLTSCDQTDSPVYHYPTTPFIVNTPALQNQEFLTSNQMTDKATFNLFCSQPDYGYSAICRYSALVSLDPQAPEEEWIALPSTNPTSAAMAIKTFELGAAVNKLLGVTSQEQFDEGNYGANTYKCYLRAVCEIPEVEGSRVVSDNYVSYNNVRLQYAEKLPAWIFICGNIQTLDNEQANGFLAPGPSNFDVYYEYFSLFEPKDMIGENIYVGQFNLSPKGNGDELGNPDAASQFRFFTELGGWSTDYSLGSHNDDFYCKPITDKVDNGGTFSGDIVDHGLGNWGIHCTEPTPVTIVVDVTALKIYVKEGLYEVSFVGRDPEFK